MVTVVSPHTHARTRTSFPKLEQQSIDMPKHSPALLRKDAQTCRGLFLRVRGTRRAAETLGGSAQWSTWRFLKCQFFQTHGSAFRYIGEGGNKVFLADERRVKTIFRSFF